MSDSGKAVKIHIMDKEYLVACPPEEQEALLALSLIHISEPTRHTSQSRLPSSG